MADVTTYTVNPKKPFSHYDSCFSDMTALLQGVVTQDPNVGMLTFYVKNFTIWRTNDRSHRSGVDDAFAQLTGHGGEPGGMIFSAVDEFTYGTLNDNGTPSSISGEIDFIALLNQDGQTIYRISLPGLTVEHLLDIADDADALAALFDGDDLYNLDDGDDVVLGRGGDDRINVGAGNNVARGGAGEDTISAVGAASGKNRFYGDADDDRMDGWNGNDKILGGTGNDTLYGRGGNDIVEGDAGDDRVSGGAGKDTLDGGEGADIFDFDTFDAGAGKSVRDVITRFERGEDRIELAGFRIDGVFGDTLEFIGKDAFTDSGQIRYTASKGTVTIYVNYEGDTGADFSITVNGLTKLAESDLTL